MLKHRYSPATFFVGAVLTFVAGLVNAGIWAAIFQSASAFIFLSGITSVLAWVLFSAAVIGLGVKVGMLAVDRERTRLATPYPPHAAPQTTYGAHRG